MQSRQGINGDTYSTGQEKIPALSPVRVYSPVKMILLGILTCGIYFIYCMYHMTEDVNTICRGEEKPLPGYIRAVLLNCLTLGIYGMYWSYQLGKRLYEIAPIYRVRIKDNGMTFLFLRLLSIPSCGITKIVMTVKLCKNINFLNMQYHADMKDYRIPIRQEKDNGAQKALFAVCMMILALLGTFTAYRIYNQQSGIFADFRNRINRQSNPGMTMEDENAPKPTESAVLEEFTGTWNSATYLESLYIKKMTADKMVFDYTQALVSGSAILEASDCIGKVEGNKVTATFMDSWGNKADAVFTFEGEQVYVSINTTEMADGARTIPYADAYFYKQKEELDPGYEFGDYFFPESDSRFLSDQDLYRSGYSADMIELARQEIYARHGRIFALEEMADYFNSKSWYHGTVQPEEFDAMQDSILNEYERANIQKLAEYEESMRDMPKEE